MRCELDKRRWNEKCYTGNRGDSRFNRVMKQKHSGSSSSGSSRSSNGTSSKVREARYCRAKASTHYWDEAVAGQMSF